MSTNVAVVQTEFKAPDGAAIACINPGEAEFMWNKIYNEAEYGKTIAPLKSSGGVVVDVGVNIGMFCRFAREAGHQVYGFEPVPFLAACARLNAPGATIIETPVSDTDNVEITIDFLPHYTMLSGKNAANNEQMYSTAASGSDKTEAVKRGFSDVVQIPCVTKTLTTALKDAGVTGPIDYLKIDCEMMEDRVLAGIDQELWDRVREVAIEVHDIDKRIESTLLLLQSKGFKAAKSESLPPSYILKESAQANVVDGLDACLVTGVRE